MSHFKANGLRANAVRRGPLGVGTQNDRDDQKLVVRTARPRGGGCGGVAKAEQSDQQSAEIWA